MNSKLPAFYKLWVGNTQFKKLIPRTKITADYSP